MPEWRKDRAVHVYYARTEHFAGDALSRLVTWLDGAERDRIGRFRIDGDRRSYIVAHALARYALAEHAAMAPAKLRFRSGRHGRPELAAMPGLPPLRFNLSHTTGLVACAVALSDDVGIDIEWNRRPAPIAVARRFFTDAEAAAILSLPSSERDERFFLYWTLKEAYVKAKGVGLLLPFDSFCFHVDPENLNHIVLESSEDDPRMWRLVSWVLGEHRCSLAVRRPETPDIVHHEWQL